MNEQRLTEIDRALQNVLACWEDARQRASQVEAQRLGLLASARLVLGEGVPPGALPKADEFFRQRLVAGANDATRRQMSQALSALQAELRGLAQELARLPADTTGAWPSILGTVGLSQDAVNAVIRQADEAVARAFQLESSTLAPAEPEPEPAAVDSSPGPRLVPVAAGGRIWWLPVNDDGEGDHSTS